MEMISALCSTWSMIFQMSSLVPTNQAWLTVETSASCTQPWEDLQASALVEVVEEQEDWVLVLALEGVLVEVKMRWPSTSSYLSFCAQEPQLLPNKGTKEPWAAQVAPQLWGNIWQT